MPSRRPERAARTPRGPARPGRHGSRASPSRRSWRARSGSRCRRRPRRRSSYTRFRRVWNFSSESRCEAAVEGLRGGALQHLHPGVATRLEELLHPRSDGLGLEQPPLVPVLGRERDHADPVEGQRLRAAFQFRRVGWMGSSSTTSLCGTPPRAAGPPRAPGLSGVWRGSSTTRARPRRLRAAREGRLLPRAATPFFGRRVTVVHVAVAAQGPGRRGPGARSTSRRCAGRPRAADVRGRGTGRRSAQPAPARRGA